MNIPVEALDAIAAVRYAALEKPESWAEDFADAPIHIKHGMREAALDLIAPAIPILHAAWEKEQKAIQGEIDVPDDISGLFGDK